MCFEERLEMAFRISRSGIRKGMLVFTALSLASIFAIALYTRSHMKAEAFEQLDPLWLLATLPMIALDWIASAYRIQMFAKVFHPRIRFSVCFKANMVNYFMGAVTPSQIGAGPAQIYVMHSGGMSAASAASSTVMNFVSTTVFLVMTAVAAIVFREKIPLPGSALRWLFTIGVLFFLFVAALVVLAVAVPGFYRDLARTIVRMLSRIRKKDYLSEKSWGLGIIAIVDRCHRQILFLFLRRFDVFLQSLLVTVVVFSAKFVLSYCIVRSLGSEVSIFYVSLLQLSIVLINYYFPSPGASGSAELSTAALMSHVVTRGAVAFYVLIWRMLAMYLPVAVGGAMMLRELGKREKIDLEECQVERISDCGER